VLFASGPKVVGTPTLTAGHAFTQRFPRPGVYRLFCYLHPVSMQQEVLVG
jgi:plastocyanin